MKSLDICLEQEYAAATRLLELLSEEYQCLMNRNLTRLEELALTKHELIGRIEMLALERDAVLNDLGLPRGINGVGSYLEKHPHVAAGGIWEKQLALLALCQHQNLRNGRLVETSRRFVEKTLAVLQGRPLTQDAYGPSGRAMDNTRHSSLYTSI